MNKKYQLLEEALTNSGLINNVSNSAMYAGLITSSLAAIDLLIHTAFKHRMKNTYIDQDFTHLIRKLTADPRPTVKVIVSEEVNAFADSQMNLYYSTGLLNKIKLSKREITAILLHEYGHAAKKDIGRTALVMYPSLFVMMTIMKSVFSGSHWLIQLLVLILGVVATKKLLDMTHGRFQEYRADKAMVKYGYGREAQSAFQKLSRYMRNSICEKEGVATDSKYCDRLMDKFSVFSSHPKFEDRMEKLLSSPAIKKFAALAKRKYKQLGI